MCLNDHENEDEDKVKQTTTWDLQTKSNEFDKQTQEKKIKDEKITRDKRVCSMKKEYAWTSHEYKDEAECYEGERMSLNYFQMRTTWSNNKKKMKLSIKGGTFWVKTN